VWFGSQQGLAEGPWFSVDHKGGSFLCRPVVVTEPEDAPWRAVSDAPASERLPEWPAVDAAFELPGGVRYFFNNREYHYLSIAADGTVSGTESIGSRWGLVRTVLPARADIDSVLTRGDHTFVFFGDRYVRFTGTPFGLIDAGYPKRIGAEPEDKLPKWSSIDVAFTDPKGQEYVYNYKSDSMVVSGALDKPITITAHRRELGLPDDFGRIVTVMTTDTATFLIARDAYVKFTHASPKAAGKPKTATEWWATRDEDYPRDIQGNPDGIPQDITINEAMWRDKTAYYFDNAAQTYLSVAADGARITRPYTVSSEMARNQRVDAAWMVDGKLYLTYGREYHRYTLGADGSIGDFSDDGYPQRMPRGISGAFRRDDQMYLFSGSRYTRVPVGQEPSTLPMSQPVAGAWAEMPRATGTPFDGVLDSETGLYLFSRGGYHRHSTTLTVRRPYELSSLPFEIIRLTTGTASELNRKLLAGGVPALLDLSTQQTDEVLVSTDPDATAAVRVRPSMVDVGRLPTGSHLDFRSANGMYYWEVFFHAPLLIAQALNGAQRFEDARRWYEYIFDPTNTRSYWRLLPFLTVDPIALADNLVADVSTAREAGLAVDPLAAAIAPVL
ncbi:MAG: hypothetical protein ACRDTJ_19125, partial [Pseudonocardiaceae bacterium]